MRHASRPAGVLLCGLFVLGLLAASALAGPVGWGASHRLSAGRAHAHSCPAPARMRNRARSRCRRFRHASAGVAPASRPTPASPGAPAGGASPGAAGSPSAGPVAPSAQGPAPGTGEAAPPGAPPSIPHVQVTALEYSFTLSRTSVPAGKVIFEFVNNGQDEHNLTVLPGEGPQAGSFPDAQPKTVSDMQLEVRKGSYTLFCSLPEHEQKGMKATLLVN